MSTDTNQASEVLPEQRDEQLEERLDDISTMGRTHMKREVMNLIRTEKLKARIDENRRAGAWWGGLVGGEKLRIGMDYMHNRDKDLYGELSKEDV